jgi:hypothetical protein
MLVIKLIKASKAMKCLKSADEPEHWALKSDNDANRFFLVVVVFMVGLVLRKTCILVNQVKLLVSGHGLVVETILHVGFPVNSLFYDF